VAAMWMREAPAGLGRVGGDSPASAAGPPGGPLPALAGGSPELDPGDELASAGADVPIGQAPGTQPEVLAVAVLAGAATIFFGIIPQPLFDLVQGTGSALGLS
jgi:hypothetical protein